MRTLKASEGQALVVSGLSMVVMIGFAGLVFDVGQAYTSQRQLQIATDAAALAAAQDLPDGDTAVTTASTYSSTAGNKNAGSLNVTSVTATPECLSTATAGTTCQTGGNTTSTVCKTTGCNAVKVTETATLKPLFMGVLGVGNRNISVSSTASMAGGPTKSMDVEVILDSTSSMAASDSCGSGVTGIPSGDTTAEDCAKAGVADLLKALQPCDATATTCGTSVMGNVTAPNDEVGLMTFPPRLLTTSSSLKTVNVSQATAATGLPEETNCTSDLSSSYFDPVNSYPDQKTTGGDTAAASGTNTYEVVPLSSDYRASDSATSLNTSSSLVNAVYWGDCPSGVYPANGGGTTSSIDSANSNGKDVTTASTTNSSGTTGTISAGGSATASTGGASTPGGFPTASNSSTATTTNVSAAGGFATSATSTDTSTASNGGSATVGGFAALQTTANESTATSGAPKTIAGFASTQSTSSTTGTSGGASTIAGFVSTSTVTGNTSSASAAGTIPIFAGSTKTSAAAAGSLSVTRPSPLVANDYVVVTITTTGVPTAAPAALLICAPTDATSRWTQISQSSSGSGTTKLTQAVFGSIRASSSAETYAFKFLNATSCSGTLAASVVSSAVAVTYTGVDPTNPVDTSATPTSATSSKTLTPPTFTLAHTGDRVFTAYSSGYTAFATGVTGTSSVSQAASSNISGLLDTASAGGTTATTSTAANWVAETVQLNPIQSITIARPSTAAANDYVIVSITATGVGSSGKLSICAPTDSNSPWTNLGLTTSGSGTTAVTQAVYGSVRATSSAESYTFSFINAATCSSSSAATVSASAVAARYTNVDPYDPVDAMSVEKVSGTASATAAFNSVTTSYANDEVVSLVADGTTTFKTIPTISVTKASTAAITGFVAQPAATAGLVTPTSATTAAAQNWATLTVALKPLQGAATISVTRPSSPAANDYIVVSVTATDLGSSGNLSICAPTDAASPWTLLSSATSGTAPTATTQAVFGSVRAGGSAETYVFSFIDGTTCAGSDPASVQASAVAARFTNVDPSDPIDVSASAATTATGVKTAAFAQLTTTLPNEAVLSIASAGGTSFPTIIAASKSGAGTSNVTGVSYQNQATAGNVTPTANGTTANQNWVTYDLALRPAQGASTITLTRPTTHAANDYLVVAVTATGVGSSGHLSVCAPDGTWTTISSATQGTGATATTQAVFGSVRTTSATETYAFSFANGASCAAATNTTVQASAVAVRYTGIDPNDPIDASGTPATGSALAQPFPALSTQYANEPALSLVSVGGTAVTLPAASAKGAGNANTTGIVTQTQASVGAVTFAQATTSPSQPYVTETLALKPVQGAPTISINRPSTVAADDYVVVTVTAADLGASGALTICAPTDVASPWTTLSPASPAATQGTSPSAITQAVFGSLRASASAESYAFSFVDGSSCSATSTASVQASAVAVTYTNVDPYNPVDAIASGAATGNSTAPAPPAVTTHYANDQVVSLISVGGTAFSSAVTPTTPYTTFASATSDTGVVTQPQSSVGAVTPGAVALPSSQNWVAFTIALKTEQGASAISINRPATQAANDYIVVAVSATDMGSTGPLTICAPTDTTSPWTSFSPTAPASTKGSGLTGVTQGVFGSVRATSGNETYAFTFVDGTSCTSSPAATVQASAVAVRYTGIDPFSPVDALASTPTSGATASQTFSSLTTQYPKDQVVSLVSATGTAFSPVLSASGVAAAGTTMVTGVVNLNQATAATVTPASVATSGAQNWVTFDLALKPLQGSSSLTIPAISGAAAGDYVVVGVTATGLPGTGGADDLTICAPPDTNSPWTSFGSGTEGSGAATVSQASFGSVRAATGTYTFTFVDGDSCTNSPPASVSASAVAVRYTGVNTGTPVDVFAAIPTLGSSKTAAPGAGAITTTVASDRVISVYSDGATSFLTSPSGLVAGAGAANVTGISDVTQTTKGASASSSATTSANQNWLAEQIALEPAVGTSSITISRPGNIAAGDTLLVSVEAEGLTASNSICAPSSDWTDAGPGAVTAGSGPTSVTEEAFYSYRAAADPAGTTFTFTFASSCSGGAPITVAGTATAVRFDGVNPVLPIDVTTSNSNTGKTLTANSVTTGTIADTVLSLYATGTTALSGATGTITNSYTAGGYEDHVQVTPGATTAQTATTTTSSPWVALTIALQPAQPGCGGNCSYGLEDWCCGDTYYAPAITAAGTVFSSGAGYWGNEGRPLATKVIILLSDGDANVPWKANACEAGIAAAETAEASAQDVQFYSIAYGASSSTSSTCQQDKNSSGSRFISGLCAMHIMADNPYTDSSAALANDTTSSMTDYSKMPAVVSTVCANNASDPAHHFYNEPSGTDLTAIFDQIGDSLTEARLVSNSAT